jgi:hypothetical protein
MSVSARLFLIGSIFTVTLSAVGSARAAEVSKASFSGPSASSEFHRVTVVTCSDGSLAVKDDTILISVAKFHDSFDGQVSSGPSGYVTIFSLNGCTGAYSAGSADIVGLRYQQAEVQHARISGRASVADFATGAPLGEVVMDFELDGIGPIAASVDHTTTVERGNFRTIEVAQGKGRDSAFAGGSVTVDGTSVGASFISPIYSLLSGHFGSTTVTF